MPRTTSSSSKSSSNSSTGATQGRGLITRYNWDPPPSAGYKRKVAEESLNENASKYCSILSSIRVVVVVVEVELVIKVVLIEVVQ